MRIERRAKCERLAFSLTTGLKPLTCFRLKAGLWHVVIEDNRKARVPALAEWRDLKPISWLCGGSSWADPS